MPQGTSIPSINPVFRDKILMGLIGKNTSAFEGVFGVKFTRQASGAIPYVPSKYSVSQSDDDALIALDAVPDVDDDELAEMSFRISKKFGKRGKVHKMAVDAMSENSGEDITELTLERAVIKICAAIDKMGKDYLTNTTLNGETINQTTAATAVWTDAANARPFTDLDALFDKIGNPDTLWLGLDKARNLAGLPAVKDEFKQFSAVDGRIAMSALADALKSHYSFLQNVVIDDVWENTANMQQTAVFSRIFDGVVWAGRSEHLKLVENTGLRKARVFFDDDTDNYIGEAVRYMTVARGEAIMGSLLTGT